jgi:uncharacterized protein YciU (UPF0263 family)
MEHQYKRRTYDEAVELAKSAFRESVEKILTKEEVDEIRESCELTGGNPKAEEWATILGFLPDEKSYYEIELYKRSDECPYIEKSYVKILVPRNREIEECYFIWKPRVLEYNGPWFS